MTDINPCKMVRVYRKKSDAPIVLHVYSMESSGESWLEVVHSEDCTHPKRRTIEERKEDKK